MPPAAEDLGQPLGVVFDTNLWRQGSLDIAKLKWHAERLQKVGIEVWIPTQVFLEWVDHARRDAEAYASLVRRLGASGIVPELPNLQRDAGEIRRQMALVLGEIPNVRVLPMDGASAIEAIVDQILGSGSGSTKSGVKTGSADSSLIRDGLKAAQDDPSGVVFVTENVKDFNKASKAMGVSLRVTSEYKLYSEALSLREPSSAGEPSGAPHVDGLPTIEEVASMVREYMESERQAVLDSDDGHSPPLYSWLALDGPELYDVDVDAPDGFEVTDVDVRPEPRLESIEDVDILSAEQHEDDGGEPTAGYSLVADFVAGLRGDLTVHGYYLDNNGQVQNDAVDVYDVLLTAPFSVEIESGEVKSLYASGRAYAEDG